MTDTPTKTTHHPQARALFSLAQANVRYWTTVAPLVRAQLAHWRRRAAAIADTELRVLALEKLEHESFNAEAGAMLATLAPRVHRADVVRAIVALQVLFDLLDGLTERPSADPLGNGQRLFATFTGAVRPGAPLEPAVLESDEQYLHELSQAARDALARLPSVVAVSDAAQATAERAAQAQIRMHAAASLGIEELRGWAEAQARESTFQWRELLAGAASSVLVVHALIAAAAELDTTPIEVEQIEQTYLSVCVVLTLLDGVIDRERDERTGTLGYLDLYEDRELLAPMLTRTARRAVAETRALSPGGEHLMMLTGVVAFYGSAPAAHGDFARPLLAQLHRDLAPSILPALLLMRAWRLAKRVRARSA